MSVADCSGTLKTTRENIGKMHLNFVMCKIWGFHGGDYEGCRLLGYKSQFVPHRRHTTSPLQSPAC
jgi:hypothetical protein